MNDLRAYNDGAKVYTDLEQFVSPSLHYGETASAPGEPVTELPGETLVESADEAAAGITAPASSLPTVDFTALSEINPDIAGWLVCDETPINYPIVKGEDNSQYLKRLFNGKRGKAGTPFLDYENSPDFTDRNSIVYGHNLLDGSMFTCLADYAEQAYYDAHPTMLLLTPQGDYVMEVYAAFTASPKEAGAVTSPWRQSWSTDGDFSAWISQARERSVVETGITPDADDKVLTLSTCVHRGSDRFVVMGRLVPAE